MKNKVHAGYLCPKMVCSLLSYFGPCFLISGINLIIKRDAILHYFQAESTSDQPPAVPRTILKYFFFFTLPCFILSLISFSWAELLFSIWSFILVYAAGIQLVRWPQTRQTVQQHPEKIKRIIKYSGVMMLAVSPVMFLLCYLVIQQI